MDLYEDDFAVYRHDAALSLVSIVWRTGTESMTDEDFKEALRRLASLAIGHAAQAILVDVRDFRHRPGPKVEPWRQAEIIPQYAAAGVVKFAYVAPAAFGMKDQSADPDAGIPFETRIFADIGAAHAWFAAG